MDAIETGPRELRSDEDPLRCAPGDFPEVRIHTRTDFRFSHGCRADTPPCGKCGCEFVNVGGPKSWPIDTVALTFAKCGSVVDYVDGLLLMTVKQALKEYTRGRRFASGNGISVALNMETPIALSGWGIAKELVGMGIDGGLSDQDIAEALEISEEYVALVAGSIGR